MMHVAALYIDPRGPYPLLAKLSDARDSGLIDCWDAERDARRYAGPFPVVAHPPCGPWGRLRHLYRGNEHDCAPNAVQQVRLWNGVLEHPAGSLLWREEIQLERLPLPGDAPDSWGGYTIEVEQVEWGHVARKRTWLYIVGVSRERVAELVEARPFPGREPTHWISGGRGRQGKKAKTTPVPPGIKVCSAQQRRRTPPAFAEFLIELAREARK
jgi:hypothetical protein